MKGLGRLGRIIEAEGLLPLHDPAEALGDVDRVVRGGHQTVGRSPIRVGIKIAHGLGSGLADDVGGDSEEQHPVQEAARGPVEHPEVGDLLPGDLDLYPGGLRGAGRRKRGRGPASTG